MHAHIRDSVALLGSCILLAALLERVRAVGSPVNNVDIFEPIVRRSPALSQPTNDMFGWATVLHQTEVVAKGDTREQAAGKTRIIVGAPRGTFPGGLPYEDGGEPKEEQTGLVYSCPVLPGTCDGVRGDTARYLGDTGNVAAARDNNGKLDSRRLTDFPQEFAEGRLFDQAPNAILFSIEEANFSVTENKTGQLLGATLFSDGENFIACAPRWTDTRFSITQLQPRGLCYATQDRTLQDFQLLRPCTDNRARSTNTLFDGYCLSGTSAISYDGGYVLGAPGLREGRGALYYSARADPTMFMHGNYTQINSATGSADDTITDSYQGFSTVSAFITTVRVPGGTPPNVVAAVPRYDGNTYAGRVNVFSPPNYSTILRSVDAQGTQMGEFFGHCMIAIDINGDNFDDLVIGAPMYTDFMNLKIERGRVYVFLNTGSGALMTSAIELNGEYPRGRFGTSLANLGDINSDGFEDFAVGAPYADNGNNTGAVYIYYGNSDRTAFETQVPFKITASDVVNYVTVLEELNTFGFSVSGGVDVDNNQYNDLVVGSYLDQTVVLLRTLPVVNVTVSISAPATVNLSSSFQVSVTAYYEGPGMTGPIVVPFVLTEVRGSSAPRLKFFFADGGRGQFTILGPGIAMINTQTVVVTSLENTTSLDPLMLQLDIQDIVRPVTPSDGNQTLSDLSSFPRLLQQGTNTGLVMIRDPCGGDGCQGNIRLNKPSRNITVTAGGPTVYTMEVAYESVGPEDAVGLSLNFTNLSKIIRNVAIQREEATPVETPCSAISDGNATCMLRVRFSRGKMERITVNFTVDQENVIGNEDDFNVGLEVISMTDRVEDRDIDTTDNAQQIVFTVVAQADISVVGLSFGGTSFDYTGVAPSPPLTITSLGRSVTLEVDINNNGPTTIREGAVTIYLANRIMGNNFILYPTRIPVVKNPNGEITCDMRVVNPDKLDTSSPQINEGRRRRSAAASRNSFSLLKRVTRQENAANTVSCIGPTVDSTTCTIINCNVSNLKPGIFTISVFTRIDERYFSTQSESGTIYNLTTSASASVEGDFYGDNPSNNTGQVTITLAPMPVEPPGESDRNLLHFILWPCIGGILLFILTAILLYFVGFFRRKRKPEEGEAEGDFNVDNYNLNPENGKEPSSPEEAAPTSEVTTL